MADLELHLERVVNAPPERVFAACVDLDAVAAWWGPAGFTSPSVILDAGVGGRYRIAMQPPEGSLFHLRGEFRAVEPPDRLVYTFVWEGAGARRPRNLVSLVFRRAPEGTTVVLDQGLFETEERYALHEAGWRDTLERLVRFLG